MFKKGGRCCISIIDVHSGNIVDYISKWRYEWKVWRVRSEGQEEVNKGQSEGNGRAERKDQR